MRIFSLNQSRIVFIALMIWVFVGTSSLFAQYEQTTETINRAVTVDILHINDHHSHLEPLNFDINYQDTKVRVKLGGFPQIVAYMNQQKAINPEALLLHAGDAVTGTVYYTLFKGKVDAELMNLVAWDAFELGNHEFDDGNQQLKNFLDILDAPVLAANVVPDGDSILAGYWDPYRIVNVKGQSIGIIGLDIAKKTKESSNPGPDITFLDEIETAQKYADELTSQGINKIILLSHIGHSLSKKLAATTRGIDLIVDGDSHSFLESVDLSPYGIEAEDTYPTMINSASGDPVAIVQAWEYTKIVGDLSVRFDADGIITDIDGEPMMLIADSFRVKNADGDRVELQGNARAEAYRVVASVPFVKIQEADPTAQALLNRYQEEKEAFGSEVLAQVYNDIPGGSALRIPFISEDPETAWGHYTAQVVAEAMLHKLQHLGEGDVDLVIQNAGGVRIPLLPGDLTVEIAYTLLPFGNTLVVAEMTGAEIVSALEDGIAFSLDGSTGAFPYTAGLRYAVDLQEEKGTRTSTVEINMDDSWKAIDPNQTYKVGINNYIAGGKDGYTTLGNIPADRKVDTYIDDAQSFIDYIVNKKKIIKPAQTSVYLKR